MDRPHWITAACCTLALALDFALGMLLYRKVRFPPSALIIGLATSLLLDSRYPWVYLTSVSLAILSKAVITYQGRHLYNPANFGVVVMLMCTPLYATGMPALFGGYFLPSIVFLLFGAFTIWYAREVTVSASWLGGFVVLAWLRAWLAGKAFLVMALPMLSATFLLFTFHMISDPATCPRSHRGKICFGLCIAAMDALFRYHQVPYGNFYSLFLATSVLPLFSHDDGPIGKFGGPGGRGEMRA